MKSKTISVSFILSFMFLVIISPVLCQETPNKMKIWFSKPAENWNEALPVGNGRLGAMVFGGIENERIQLNEESVWTGQQLGCKS